MFAYPTNVSVLPRRVANPNWHTLSRFCVTQLFVIVQMAHPLTLFPINKHPRLHQLYPAAGQTQNLHTLSTFLLIPPHGKFKICIPYQCFFLPRRGANSNLTPYQCFFSSRCMANSKYAYPLSVSSCHAAGPMQNINVSCHLIFNICTLSCHSREPE